MPNHESQTDQQKHYKRPPITEAVIELQFAASADFKTVDQAKEIFAQNFPILNAIHTTTLFPQLAAVPAVAQSQIGFRMDNADSTDIISLTTNAFAYSRLAPYN